MARVFMVEGWSPCLVERLGSLVNMELILPIKNPARKAAVGIFFGMMIATCCAGILITLDN